MTTTLRVSPALSLAALPAGSSAVADLLLTLSTESASGPGFGARLPLEVSVVLDRSGSMSGQPLQKALAATEVLLDALGPDDTVSVVVFDDKVSTALEPARLTNAAAAKKVLKNIRPGGSTALHAGWVKGCGHVAGRPSERVVRRVLLLTDGQANHGVTDPKTIIEQARKQGAGGVSTTTLGFGSDFNEDLLIGMAEASGGNFYYIETPEEATQVFAIEGEALTSIAAERVTLTLSPRVRGVRIVEVLNRLPSRELSGGGVEIFVGEMYHAEDKLIAVRLEIDSGAELATGVELVDVRFTYEPVPAKRGEVREGAVSVRGAVAKEKALADPDTLRKVARIRVARTKERAVELSDARKHAEAAGVFRELAGEIHERGLDDEFDMAEELAQIEHFAASLGKAPLRGDDRKILRDQSYQGRTRSRSDLMARGGGGGSAASLPEVTSAAGGVELLCVREGGKLRVRVLTPGYEADLPVLIPRGVREEGVRYVADKIGLASNSTFYKAEGQLRRLKGGMAAAVLAESGGDLGDPLKLTELFAGGGEPWMAVLKAAIEAQPSAPTFIGPGRDKNVVPVRELTFQALKPNPPHRWKVVVFGQNPYPRVESATGIAMFDNAFGKWTDSQFGKTVSMRCIIKAGAMWKYKAKKATPIAELRKLLADKKVVQPPEWFQSMLTQGVLLLNASLTASSDGSMSTDQHTAFWRPAVEALIEEILRSKQGAAEADRGVVFAWWGAHARNLRSLVDRLAKKYPAVMLRHVDHCNPAAQGDTFCDGDHFAAVNAALRSVKATEVDWLPSVGWNAGAVAAGAAAEDGHAERMGDFIAKTMDLHKMYLERLQEVAAEVREVLSAITGVGDTPLMSFADAVKPLSGAVTGIEHYFKRSQQYAEAQAARESAGAGGALSSAGLGLDEIAAVYLYTTESPFYRKLNAALRAVDRGEATPWFGYLRLLLGAMARLQTYAGSLFRGVAADLRKHYPKGETITWWGVSSCTAKRSVATSFLGTKGKRTLFEVRATRAVSIRRYSAFTGEDEYLLAPGTQLIVSDVKAEKDGLCTVTLTESPATPLVT